mmetsp:Transcript_20229/g.52206  ORF Transcript_20229/g.52206 Transcript_20229/m.52206 type:complete len:254 (-) Transcript_20229:592-1353(-)
MMGLSSGLADASRTCPRECGRAAIVWIVMPSASLLLLWKNLSAMVLIPSGEMVLLARKRYWMSGWSSADLAGVAGCSSRLEYTKPPWSHPGEVSGPLPMRNCARAIGLIFSEVPSFTREDCDWPFASGMPSAVHETRTAGWSWRLAPTPGRSCTTFTPRSSRCSLGPTPLVISRCGEPIAPSVSSASPFDASLAVRSTPSASTKRTPVARLLLSSTTPVACAEVTTSRFGRPSTGSRYELAASERLPPFSITW